VNKSSVVKPWVTDFYVVDPFYFRCLMGLRFLQNAVEDLLTKIHSIQNSTEQVLRVGA
jgi:hypothetical protein